MQDVVRASGLSVGAIYTYFKGKDELFLAACDLSSGRGLGELADRLAAGTSTAEKLAIAIGFFLDTMDATEDGLPGSATFLVQAWAEAAASRRCGRCSVGDGSSSSTVGQLLLREGIARGELPRWMDAEATARPTSRCSTACSCCALEQATPGPPSRGRAPSVRAPRAGPRCDRRAARPIVPRPAARPFSLGSDEPARLAS